MNLSPRWAVRSRLPSPTGQQRPGRFWGNFPTVWRCAAAGISLKMLWELRCPIPAGCGELMWRLPWELSEETPSENWKFWKISQKRILSGQRHWWQRAFASVNCRRVWKTFILLPGWRRGSILRKLPLLTAIR